MAFGDLVDVDGHGPVMMRERRRVYRVQGVPSARFLAVEGALREEFGVEFQVYWSALSSRVEFRRVDGGGITGVMVASFARAWGMP